jgi:hypothetical protein
MSISNTTRRARRISRTARRIRRRGWSGEAKLCLVGCIFVWALVGAALLDHAALWARVAS